MGKRVGRYPEAFRRVAVERMRKLRNVSVLARELEIDLHKNANGGIEPPAMRIQADSNYVPVYSDLGFLCR